MDFRVSLQFVMGVFVYVLLPFQNDGAQSPDILGDSDNDHSDQSEASSALEDNSHVKVSLTVILMCNN